MPAPSKQARKGFECFNPRPAVRPGDAKGALIPGDGYTQFQSAPGREAGRCALKAAIEAAKYAFQSAPGREAGRCGAGPTGEALHPDHVSIRARP